jgi:hypothetical protein
MVSRSRILESSALGAWSAPGLIGTLVGVSLAVLSAGCNGVNVSGATDELPEDAAPTVRVAYNPDASDAGGPEASVSGDGLSIATAALPYQGNSLCNASRSTGCCYPDDPASAQTCAQAACTAPDGGPAGTGAYIGVTFGCHVLPAPAANAADGGPIAACLPGGQGIDGFPCKGPQDCAASYECVGAVPTCQRYCCDGNEACLSLQFCDIQPTALSPQVQVPVCMPMEGCVLLSRLSCPANETCAVVRDDGSKSCVAIGNAAAGQSCETDHCADGLVCLGATGMRSCYVLCHTGPSFHDCSPTQKCQGGLPLFPDPEFGICQ